MACYRMTFTFTFINLENLPSWNFTHSVNEVLNVVCYGVLWCAGIITVGNDISQLFVSIVLSYYTGRGHRPRWIALGIYTVVLYCLMTALPHLLYGPGEDALALTVEYGGIVDYNATQEVKSKSESSTLLRRITEGTHNDITYQNLRNYMYWRRVRH